MLHFDLDGEEIPSGFTTIAGLILEQLKKIPHQGETLTYKGLTLEVVDMDGVRIDKILVTRQP